MIRMSSKQIRLQVSLKLFGLNSWIPQMIRQWIPDCWSSDRKCGTDSWWHLADRRCWWLWHTVGARCRRQQWTVTASFYCTCWGITSHWRSSSIIITFFAVSCIWDVSGNLSKLGVFRRGWVTLSASFTRKGVSPTNHCWCQKIRVLVFLCRIKISALHCLVLSQSTHVTDGRTDGITTPKTALA